MNVYIALATVQKGNQTMADYLTKMKALVDDMAASGKTLDHDELVSYIFTSLDSEYNPIVSSILTRSGPISIGDLYSQLMSFDQHLDLQR